MAERGWLVSIVVSGGNPSFLSSVIIFKTPSCFSSHSIHASHHLCWFWFQLSQLSGDEAIPVGVDRNVGMVTVECVSVCVSGRFMTLISKEGGSLLCNLLTSTIQAHLREPPFSSSFTHSSALHFTFFTVSLLRFLLDLWLRDFVSWIAPSLVGHLFASFCSQILSSQ